MAHTLRYHESLDSVDTGYKSTNFKYVSFLIQRLIVKTSHMLYNSVVDNLRSNDEPSDTEN